MPTAHAPGTGVPHTHSPRSLHAAGIPDARLVPRLQATACRSSTISSSQHAVAAAAAGGPLRWRHGRLGAAPQPDGARRPAPSRASGGRQPWVLCTSAAGWPGTWGTAAARSPAWRVSVLPPGSEGRVAADSPTVGGDESTAVRYGTGDECSAPLGSAEQGGGGGDAAGPGAGAGSGRGSGPGDRVLGGEATLGHDSRRVGTLTYRASCLRGTPALRLAFPQHTSAASNSAAEGRPAAKQAVQLYGRLPDGQLKSYDVTLYPVHSCFHISRTRLLARDLGLRDGSKVELTVLPDGRVVAEALSCPESQPWPATAAKPRIPANTLLVRRKRNVSLSGMGALRSFFPAQLEAAHKSRTRQTVRVYGRLPGGELRPYDLILNPDFVSTSFVARFRRIGRLAGDLGLQDGDTVRLCALPDGRVVVEPTNPRPAALPDAVVLKKDSIQFGGVAVPKRLAAWLLGEEQADSVTGPEGFPLRLEGGDEAQLGSLRRYLHRAKGYKNTVWYALQLGVWLRAQGASPGDRVVLQRVSGGEAAPAVRQQEDQAAPVASEGPAIIARLVRGSGPGAKKQ